MVHAGETPSRQASGDYEDRARRVADDRCCGGPENHALETAEPSGSDDDEVGDEFVDGVKDHRAHIGGVGAPKRTP